MQVIDANERDSSATLYESAALPTELRRLYLCFLQFTMTEQPACLTSVTHGPIFASSFAMASVTSCGGVLM
jgi:hypothetical protein